MELLFFERNTLLYKDYGLVDSDFDINMDLVIRQKSTFKVNKTKLNIKLGDIVIIKGFSYFYIGVIESIELEDKHHTIVHTIDFKEMFNLDVLVSNFTGDVAQYLENLINDHFIQSSDPNQNLNYLTVINESSVQGTLYFDEDKIMAISDVIELITKSYGVSVLFEVVFLRGRVTGIKLRIVEITRGLKIKSSITEITDLVINDSEAQMTNKVVFYPQSDNEINNVPRTYFLLTDGSITEEVNHPNRYRNVNAKAFMYSDSETETLSIKARNEMISSKLDHHISFVIKKSSKLVTFNLGDFVEFITESKTYDSIVTALRYEGSLNKVAVTLGEYRIRLTDKIKLLNKSVKTNAGNVHISQANITNLDGGEF